MSSHIAKVSDFRADTVLEKLPDFLAEILIFGAELEIHTAVSHCR
jgi:hypothetical protein